jgi:hypothetical protein
MFSPFFFSPSLLEKLQNSKETVTRKMSAEQGK